MMSPRTYDLAEEITFEIKDTGEVQTVAMKDAPIEIKGQVDKRQELVQPIEKGLLANGDGKTAPRRKPIVMGFSPIPSMLETIPLLGLMSLRLPMILSAPKTAQRDSSQSKPPSPSATSTVCATYGIARRRWTRQTSMSRQTRHLTMGTKMPWLESDEVKESLGEDCRLVDYDGWRLWKADVSTTESTTLEAEELDLAPIPS